MDDSRSRCSGDGIDDVVMRVTGDQTVDNVILPKVSHTENTVVLAKKEREQQGRWELEISYGGEADLHKHYIDCEKDPEHLGFIPVDQFNNEHLPPSWRDEDLVDLVRAVSDVTVRLLVEYVSEDRPEMAYGKPYPCYKDRRDNMKMVGTGWIEAVYIYRTDGTEKTCQCKVCENSSTPETNFAEIYVRTGAHVVYDNQEAAQTTCHLFFDKGDKVEDCADVVALTGWYIHWRSGHLDWCELRYSTHDLEMATKIREKGYTFVSVREKVKNKFSNMTRQPLSLVEKVPDCEESCYVDRTICVETKQTLPLLEAVPCSEDSSDVDNEITNKTQMPPLPVKMRHDPVDNLTIIVSHPHGYSKQISIGECEDKTKIPPHSILEYKYTASTCPGSSGAPVGIIWVGRKLDYYYFSHSGNCEDKNFNFCCDQLNV